MTVKQKIEDMIAMYSQIGHPGLLERFVLRNGKDFEVVLHEFEFVQKGIRIGVRKECFKNATDLAFSDENLRYVEGYGVRKDLGLLIHHAWVVDEHDRVIDNTWNDPEDCSYFGVIVATEVLETQILKNMYYGLFTSECMIDVDFLFEIDPGLQDFLPKRV